MLYCIAIVTLVHRCHSRSSGDSHREYNSFEPKYPHKRQSTEERELEKLEGSYKL